MSSSDESEAPLGSEVSGTVDTLVTTVERVVSEEMSDAMTVDHQQLQSIWTSAMTLATRSSPVKQFGMGFGLGWLSGYLFKRVSRTAAFLVGCTFIVFQGATALGVVSVNWNRLQSIARRNMRLAEGHVSVIRRASGLEDDNSSFSESVLELAHRHMYLSSGFASGAVVAITF